MAEVRNLTELLTEIKAEFFLKSFVMDGLYSINRNIDKGRTQQCDHTVYLDNMK